MHGEHGDQGMNQQPEEKECKASKIAAVRSDWFSSIFGEPSGI